MVNNNSIITMWELEQVFSHPQITYDENERPKVNINPHFFSLMGMEFIVSFVCSFVGSSTIAVTGRLRLPTKYLACIRRKR